MIIETAEKFLYFPKILKQELSIYFRWRGCLFTIPIVDTEEKVEGRNKEIQGRVTQTHVHADLILF